MSRGHVPERSCVACRTKRSKQELLRVVLQPASAAAELALDTEQRLPGRGAYICNTPACLQAGLSRGGFDRTLRVKVPAAARQNLLRMFTMGVNKTNG